MSQQKNQFTHDQQHIVDQYVSMHGLSPEQISFDENSLVPSFDHNAISVLSLRLTDIHDISPTRTLNDGSTITVFGQTVLPDGRTRGSIGSCKIGETLANGKTASNDQIALGVATSRCFRQAIRNVGIDLHKAHLQFLATGDVAQGNTRQNPRQPINAEIHMLATELDLIVDGDKKEYRRLMAEMFDGIESSTELNDLQLHQFRVSLRAMAARQRNKATQQAA